MIARLAAVSRFSRSIRVQIAALILVFALPPVLLYSVFRAAEAEKQELLAEAVRENGEIVGRAIAPLLRPLDPLAFDDVQAALARFESDSRSVKVLFGPRDRSGFLYVASVPSIPFDALEDERRRLGELGVLDRLAESCSGNVPLAARVVLAGGGEEVLTSVTPVKADRGCWAIVVAARREAIVGLIDGRAYWRRPETRIAAAVYATMALLVFLIFAAAWSALAHFRRTAAAVETGGRFADGIGVPEFEQIGHAFDDMVARLQRATTLLHQAAEDNAHAFKGPIAVIRQATALLGEDESRRTLGVGAIAASCDRLEGLVHAARRLDAATADLLAGSWTRIDLSALVNAFADDYRTMLGPKSAALALSVAPEVHVRGRDDMIETVLENLVENALSFSPPGSVVRVALAADDADAVLTVADEGPGVEEARLPRIFERYYSSRPEAGPEASSLHFGIGLWIVKHNILTLGGSVVAANRPEGGLSVTVRLPRAGGATTAGDGDCIG